MPLFDNTGIPCRIVGAGDFYPNLMDRDIFAYNIAADGGLLNMLESGIFPDITVGDFDSLGYVPRYGKVLVFPREKDDSDVAIAVKHGIDEGCTSFELHAVTGGRLDHTVANLQILTFLSKKGFPACIVDRAYTITAVTDATVRLCGGAGDTVSVFAFNGTAAGVTLRGFKYPLNDAQLFCDNPIGLSNELTDTDASITVKNGTLIIVVNTTIDKITIKRELLG